MTRYHAAKIRLFEMGIIYTFDAREPLTWVDKSSVSTIHAQNMLISNLSKSVDAIREYLDYFLSTNMAVDNRLPLEEWFRFVLAFFVAYKLSVKLREFPQWDVRYARETLDLEKYLTAFIDRFRASQADQDISVASSGEDIYSVLPDVLESARASFIVARDHPEQIDSQFRAHIDPGSVSTKKGTSSGTTPFPSTAHKGCPATGFWRAEAVQADTNWLTPPVEAFLGDMWSSQAAVEHASMHGSCPLANTWDNHCVQADMSAYDWFGDAEGMGAFLPSPSTGQQELASFGYIQ